MTATVDQRRRALAGPAAPPFTPEQEGHIRELISDQLRRRATVWVGVPGDYRRLFLGADTSHGMLDPTPPSASPQALRRAWGDESPSSETQL